MDGHAEDGGRVYQSSRDQHISEYHYHGSEEPGLAGPDSVRHPAVGRAPVVLRDRAEVLERLQRSVTAGEGGQAFVLHGMGGCGKTTVAHAVFGFATRTAGCVGLWVNASDRAGLRSGMLAVAADRGATDGELLAARNGLRPGADLVWEHLDRSAEPWLLVLDNADDPEILRDGGWLRTSPRGIVVVTTRRAAARWWPGAELQHIGVLPREDAARVLCDLAPHSGTLGQAAEIADRLGRLPLALTLAGGFLSHQVLDPWTMDAYRRHLDERPMRRFGSSPPCTSVASGPITPSRSRRSSCTPASGTGSGTSRRRWISWTTWWHGEPTASARNIPSPSRAGRCWPS